MRKIILILLYILLSTQVLHALNKAEEIASSYAEQLKPLVPLNIGELTIHKVEANKNIVTFESEIDLEGIFGDTYNNYLKMTHIEKANKLRAFFKEVKRFQAKNLCSDKNLHELFKNDGKVEYNYYNTYNRKIGNVLVEQTDCFVK